MQKQGSLQTCFPQYSNGSQTEDLSLNRAHLPSFPYKSLFITNLKTTVSDEQVKEILSKYGRVKAAVLSLGFSFSRSVPVQVKQGIVEFESSADAFSAFLGGCVDPQLLEFRHPDIEQFLPFLGVVDATPLTNMPPYRLQAPEAAHVHPDLQYSPKTEGNRTKYISSGKFHIPVGSKPMPQLTTNYGSNPQTISPGISQNLLIQSNSIQPPLVPSGTRYKGIPVQQPYIQDPALSNLGPFNPALPLDPRLVQAIKSMNQQNPSFLVKTAQPLGPSQPQFHPSMMHHAKYQLPLAPNSQFRTPVGEPKSSNMPQHSPTSFIFGTPGSQRLGQAAKFEPSHNNTEPEQITLSWIEANLDRFKGFPASKIKLDLIGIIRPKVLKIVCNKELTNTIVNKLTDPNERSLDQIISLLSSPHRFKQIVEEEQALASRMAGLEGM